MIDTHRLIPPAYGPTTDPVLFGVSDALAKLFPLQAPRPSDQSWATAARGDAAEAATAPPSAPAMPTTA